MLGIGLSGSTALTIATIRLGPLLILGDQPAPALLLPVLDVGRQGLNVEHVAAPALGQLAGALEQELPDVVAAEALHDRQPLRHGERLEPAHPERARRLVADIGHDMSGAEVMAVELLGVRHVQLADEAGGAHREGLQRVLPSTWRAWS